MDNSKALGEEKISKLLFRFSIPTIVGMMVNALYNVIDGIFIGRYVGDLGLAGIGICHPIMMVILACILLISYGGISIVSIRLGEDKKEDAEVILGNVFVLLFITSISLFIFTLAFTDNILIAFGTSDAILPFAKDYLSILCFGFLFQFMGLGMNYFIRSEGNPKIAMLTMLIGCILNIILDALFILVFDMGIKGAALATVISQFASFVWVLNYFLSGKSLLKIRKINLKLKLYVIKSILYLGFPLFSMQISDSLAILIINKALIEYGGDLSISTYRIINNISILFIMPVLGLKQGAQPIIGYNFGAKNYQRVKKTLLLSISVATTFVTIGFLVTRFLSLQVIMIFNPDTQELIDISLNAVRIFFITLPLIGVQIIGPGYFQSIGYPKKSFFLNLLRQVFILIPAALTLPKVFDLNGVWMATPIADFVSFLLVSVFLIKNIKYLEKQEVTYSKN